MWVGSHEVKEMRNDRGCMQHLRVAHRSELAVETGHEQCSMCGSCQWHLGAHLDSRPCHLCRRSHHSYRRPGRDGGPGGRRGGPGVRQRSCRQRQGPGSGRPGWPRDWAQLWHRSPPGQDPGSDGSQVPRHILINLGR